MSFSDCISHRIGIQDLLEKPSVIDQLLQLDYCQQSLTQIIHDLVQHIKTIQRQHQQNYQYTRIELQRSQQKLKDNQQYIEELLRQNEDLKILYDDKVQESQKKIQDLSISEYQTKLQCTQLDSQLHQQIQQKLRHTGLLQKIINQKQQLITKLKLDYKTLSHEHNKLSNQSCRFKQQIQSLNADLATANQQIKQIQTINSELQIQNRYLQNQIEQVQYISQIRQKQQSQKLSQISSQDRGDDKIKLKQIADNYKHNQIKIDDIKSICHRSIQGSSQYYDNISINLNHTLSKYNSAHKKQSETHIDKCKSKDKSYKKKYQSQLKLDLNSSAIQQSPQIYRQTRKRTTTEFEQNSYCNFQKQIDSKNKQIERLEQKIQQLHEQIAHKVDIIVQLEGTLEINEDSQKQELINYKRQIDQQQRVINILEKQLALKKLENTKQKNVFMQEKAQLLCKIQKYCHAIRQSQYICHQYEQIIEKQQYKNLSQKQQLIKLNQHKKQLLNLNSIDHKSAKLSLYLNVSNYQNIYQRSYSQRQVQVNLQVKHQQVQTHSQVINSQILSQYNKCIQIQNIRIPTTQHSIKLDSSFADIINQQKTKPKDEMTDIRKFLEINEQQQKEQLQYLYDSHNRYSVAYSYDKLPSNQSIYKPKNSLSNIDIPQQDKQNDYFSANCQNSGNSLQINSYRSILENYKRNPNFKNQFLRMPLFRLQSKMILKDINYIPCQSVKGSIYLIQCFNMKKNERDRMLLWNQGLISLCEKQALLNKKNKCKRVKDPSIHVLGNHQIIVQGKKLKTRRQGKKTYFFGDLDDNEWQIDSMKLVELVE